MSESPRQASSPREGLWPLALYPVLCLVACAAGAIALLLGPAEDRARQGLGTVLLLAMALLTVPGYLLALVGLRASFRGLSGRATWLVAWLAALGTPAALALCLAAARAMAGDVTLRPIGDVLFPFGAPVLAPVAAVGLAAIVARRLRPAPAASGA